MILALRGILVGRDRETQHSGLYAGPQEGRRNINGVAVVMVVGVLSSLDVEKILDDAPRQMRSCHLLLAQEASRTHANHTIQQQNCNYMEGRNYSNRSLRLNMLIY